MQQDRPLIELVADVIQKVLDYKLFYCVTDLLERLSKANAIPSASNSSSIMASSDPSVDPLQTSYSPSRPPTPYGMTAPSRAPERELCRCVPRILPQDASVGAGPSIADRVA
jgi:hypothetical protein